MHNNAVYQETTCPIYRGEQDVRGYHNPLAGLPQPPYPQQAQLNWSEQNGQTSIRLRKCSLKNIDSRRPKRLWRLAIVTVLLVIISVAVSCGTMLLLFNYTDIFSSKFDSQMQTLCVPCPKSSASNVRELILVKKSAEGNTKNECCVINKELLEKMITPTRKNSSRDTFGFSNLSNNSIHIFLDVPETKKEADRTYKGMDATYFTKVKGWTDRINGAFSRSRVQLNNAKDEIYVKDAGLYVIYSRLEFNGPSVELDSDATVSVTEPVWFGQQLNNLLSEQKSLLLEDSEVKTCVSDEDGSLPCYTSQLFAVLYLNKSTRLSLEARPINLISENVRNSYFGLFKIE